MSGSLKLGIALILGVLAVGIAIRLISGVLGLIGPLAIVFGIGLILYSLINRKALGGSGRRYLP